jgi:hypothetical protein
MVWGTVEFEMRLRRHRVYIDNERRRTNFIVVFGRNRPDYIYLIGLIWNSMETLVHKAGCWQISVV